MARATRHSTFTYDLGSEDARAARAKCDAGDLDAALGLLVAVEAGPRRGQPGHAERAARCLAADPGAHAGLRLRSRMILN